MIKLKVTWKFYLQIFLQKMTSEISNVLFRNYFIQNPSFTDARMIVIHFSIRNKLRDEN